MAVQKFVLKVVILYATLGCLHCLAGALTPDPPTGLSAVQTTSTTIRVYWTPPTAMPTGYEITYFAGEEDSSGTVVSVSGGSTENHEISNLNNSTITYLVSIVSVNGATRSSTTGPVLAARGPGIALKGTVLPNHGVLTFTGEDDDALYCITDDVTCCGTAPSPGCCGTYDNRTGNGGFGNGRANWYYHSDYQVPPSNGNTGWYARWLTGAVLLNFYGNGTDITAELFRCAIRDSMGALHQFYTCLYDNSDDYQCVPFIEDDITFTQAESFNPLNPQFNLTCNSTSGPATVVTWLRDGNIVVYDTNHVLTQTVGTFIMYSNVLTVTGREPGNYLCNITNVRGHDTSTFIVEAPHPPTGLRAILFTSSNTLSVSWTPPSVGSPPTGYMIYYEATRGGADTGSATVSGASTSTLAITGRTRDMYTVRIVALSVHLPSVVAETTAMLDTQDPPTGLSAVHTTSTTIHVYWTPPTAMPTGYEITYFAGEEDSSGTVVSVSGGSTENHEISNLNNSTITYRVSIVSVNGATRSSTTGPVLAARGPGIALNGVVLPNHGVHPFTIGEDDDALYCITDDVTCCGTAPSSDCCGTSDSRTGDGGIGNGRGYWYYHSDFEVPSKNGNTLWYATWLTGAVLLNFYGNATEFTAKLFRCEIRDSMGALHQFYTCLYDNSDDYHCVPFIEDDITFNQAELFNPLIPQFSLTCSSTGGPATTVTWIRDGITVLYDANHVLTQTVGTFISYSNVLTVTGREPGNYRCNVANDRGHATSTFTVVASHPPTGLKAILFTSSNTLSVSWTPPSVGSPPTGYMIYYEATRGGADTGSATVSGASTSTLAITGRTRDMYTVRIVALSVHLPSVVAETTAMIVAQGLYFGGSAVDNHGIVTLDEIMNTESTALLCITPAVDCCTAPGSADWFSPSGSVISTATSSATYQVKGSFYTNLRRSSGGLEGIYRCDIRLSVGAASTSFYVGVYRSGDGVLTISDPLRFSLVSAVTADPPVFTLTCVSTGGPATSITWIRDGINVTFDSTHVFTRTVVDALTARYSNTLTVTGVEGGSYQCTASNALGTAMSPVLNLTSPSAPTNIIVSEVTGFSVEVSWTAPIGNVELLGYLVSFERFSGRGCDSPHSDTDHVNSITTDYTVVDLSGFSTYRIFVTATSIFGSSNFIASDAIDTLPSRPTGPPANVTTTISGTSVVVRWSPVPCLQRNSEITGYLVRYMEVTNSRATPATIAVDGSTTSVTTGCLKGLTRYSIDVAAIGGGETGVFSSPIITETTISYQENAPTSSCPLVSVAVGCTLGTAAVYTVILLITLCFLKRRSHLLNLRQCPAYGEATRSLSSRSATLTSMDETPMDSLDTKHSFGYRIGAVSTEPNTE